MGGAHLKEFAQKCGEASAGCENKRQMDAAPAKGGGRLELVEEKLAIVEKVLPRVLANLDSGQVGPPVKLCVESQHHVLHQGV